MLRPICSAALLVCALGACENHVYIVDAVVPDDAYAFDPALVGSWVSDGAERAVVTAHSYSATRDSFYLVQHTKRDGKVTRLIAARAQLGEQVVLELRQADYVETQWPSTGMLLVVSVDGDTLTMSYLGRDSLRVALARGDIRLSSLEQDDDVILTDSTSRLGPALTHYLRRPGVLGEAQVWRRLRP